MLPLPSRKKTVFGSVHRRIATKCIAYDRIGALEARTHAIAHFWDDTMTKPAPSCFCVKTLNGRFSFHIELDLLPLQEDIWRGRMDRAQMGLRAGGAL